MKKAARQTVNDALSDVHVANVLLYWYSACPGIKKTLLKAFPVSQPKTWKYLVWNVHLGEHVIEGSVSI